MILDWMLKESPVFLFGLSAFVLILYAATRLGRACMRPGRRLRSP